MLLLSSRPSPRALAAFALTLCLGAPGSLHAAAAHLLLDANPLSPPAGAPGFYTPPSQFATLGGRALFLLTGSAPFARIPGPGVSLWSTDGSEEGTTLIAAFCADDAAACQGAPRFLGQTGAIELFEVPTSQFGKRAPWRSDGTAAGTGKVADLAPGPAPSRPSPTS